VARSIQQVNSVENLMVNRRKDSETTQETAVYWTENLGFP